MAVKHATSGKGKLVIRGGKFKRFFQFEANPIRPTGKGNFQTRLEIIEEAYAELADEMKRDRESFVAGARIVRLLMLPWYRRIGKLRKLRKEIFAWEEADEKPADKK